VAGEDVAGNAEAGEDPLSTARTEVSMRRVPCPLLFDECPIYMFNISTEIW
jgi:hypothetical protein